MASHITHSRIAHVMYVIYIGQLPAGMLGSYHTTFLSIHSYRSTLVSPNVTFLSSALLASDFPLLLHIAFATCSCTPTTPLIFAPWCNSYLPHTDCLPTDSLRKKTTATHSPWSLPSNWPKVNSDLLRPSSVSLPVSRWLEPSSSSSPSWPRPISGDQSTA